MASRIATVSPARAAAFDVLQRVFEDGAYADRAFRTSAAHLDERDRALAQRLAFGAVQRIRTLDHAIETLGRRRVRRLDPPVRAALRLGAYQLGFVDGVPRYAAVNESVELVRRAGLHRAVAFTNAVLRRVADGIGPLLAEGVPDADVPGAWHVDRVDEAALAEGRVWPQSAASQLVGLVVGAQVGERTLDLCAAPGGKATMLAGEVTAVELNEKRARELEETCGRLGAANVRIVVADGRALPAELTGFDRALVDAPCSGLGVLNRRPDLRWRAEPLPQLQLELLRAAADRVRLGGTIVYSVCTMNADESEAVVDASGLEVDATLADEWPRFRHARRPEFLQTLPHVHGTAGFFVARLIVR
jgi:16S rRNA (cytosine967-C5)-methyltransferase